jgi:hypothetical protein
MTCLLSDFGEVNTATIPLSASVASSGVVSLLNTLGPSIAGRAMSPTGSREEDLSSGRCSDRCPGSESNESDGFWRSHAIPSLECDIMDAEDIADPALLSLGRPSTKPPFDIINSILFALDLA